jgi:hypothetical protein
VSGREAVMVIADALRINDHLYIHVQANEGLLLWAADGTQFRVDVVEHP